MSQPEGTQEPRSLVSMVDAIRTGATAVGGVAMFVPALVALALQWERAAPRDIAIAVLPALVAVLVWILRPAERRAAILVSAGFALLISELLLTSPDGPVWPPIASATFALIVIAVGGLSSTAALGAIVGASTLCFMGVRFFPDRVTLISTELLGGWITPLVDVALGLAILVVLTQWRQTAAHFDATMNAVREEAERVQLEREVDEARRSVDRRLHETVLNTLLVLSGSPDHDAAREQCRRDLALIDDINAPAPRDLGSVLEEAVSRVPGLTVHVTASDPTLTPGARACGVLRDALVELLRNVERHAGSTHARLDVTDADGELHIVVEDDGVGITADRSAGFGMRETVQRSLHSLGGTVTWSTRTPQGARVEISMPAHPLAPVTIGPTSREVLLGPVWARAAMNSTIVVGFVAIPAAAGAFSTSPWILSLFALQVLAVVTLILRREGILHSLAMAGTLSAGLATILAATSLSPSCDQAVPMHWIIFSAAGGVVLVVLSLQSWASRLAVILLVLGVSVFSSLPYPPPCLIDPLDAAMENAVWIIAITLVVGILSATVDRARVRALDSLQATASMRAANAAVTAAAQRWHALSVQSRALVEDVAQGRIEAGAPSVQRAAIREGTLLRSRLEIGQLSSEEARQTWERLLTRAYARDTLLSLRVRRAISCGPLDSRAQEGLTDLLDHCPGARLDIAILNDSLLCSVECEGKVTLPPPWRLLEVTPEGLKVLEWPGARA